VLHKHFIPFSAEFASANDGSQDDGFHMNDAIRHKVGRLREEKESV
jgi:hypothetical protein